MASYFDASTLDGFDLSSHDTVTKGLIFNSLVCMAVVVLVTTLRLYVRHSIKHAAGLDDCKSQSRLLSSSDTILPPTKLCSVLIRTVQSNS
jgi:hypothetical protein